MNYPFKNVQLLESRNFLYRVLGLWIELWTCNAEKIQRTTSETLHLAEDPWCGESVAKESKREFRLENPWNYPAFKHFHKWSEFVQCQVSRLQLVPKKQAKRLLPPAYCFIRWKWWTAKNEWAIHLLLSVIRAPADLQRRSSSHQQTRLLPHQHTSVWGAQLRQLPSPTAHHTSRFNYT